MWTPLVRNTILVLFGLYVIELVLGWQEVGRLLAMWPISGGALVGSSFAPWQPLTFPFVQGEPRDVIWQFVAIFFFLQPTADALGQRRLWFSTLFVWAFACAVKFAAEAVGFLSAVPIVGCGFWVEALVVWFGFSHRGQPVRFMLFIPMRAEFLAWGSGLLSLLYLLFSRDTASLFMVAAFGAAWASSGFDPDIFRRWRLQRRKRKIERELSKFQVIDGGKTARPRRADPNDWVN